MIARIIEWSLRNRFLVICATLILVAWGLKALRSTPIDAIPDLSENQVLVFADWPGRSPQEVEDQVTYPLSVTLQGLAGVKAVRANSMFGFSLVTVVFEDKIDNYFARSRVLERLNFLGSARPAGVTPLLGPDATGLGWIYQYSLVVDPAAAPGGGYDLGQLRALQDFFVRYQLQAVAGVAEVASVGGFAKQYQVEVSSAKLRAAGVPLQRVLEAVGQANLNVGGKVIEENGMEFVVRGVGLITNAADLELVVVAEKNNTPIYLRDVASVEIGGAFRRGALDVGGHEAVGGIVVMRTGGNARQVIDAVKEKIRQISPSLPPGVSIKPFYDRSELIGRTIDTLRVALVEEIILVTLAHIVFLFHFRSILIVTIPLPVSILVSFILMNQFGISSNIMSLSGIAIAIGVLVDAGIVMTENVIRHCERAEEEKAGRWEREKVGGGESEKGSEGEGSPAHLPTCPPARLTSAETWNITLKAAQQVGRPIFFAMAIVILAFVPVFVLGGQAGKLFHPLAWTKTFALVGATVLAVTIVPVLCSLLVRGPFHREDRNWIIRLLLGVYEPVLDWALRRRKTVLALAAVILLFSQAMAWGLPKVWFSAIGLSPSSLPARLFAGFGREFMPTLNEGSLLFMPVLLPSTSLTEVKRIMSWQDAVIRDTPEVESVAGKLGRAETATDPAPVEMIETTIMLKPEFIADGWRVKRNPAWREGMTIDALKAELSQKLTAVPGYVPGFLQPIENRVLMISTGIRAQVGVKILGDNLDALQAKAFEVEKVVREISGAVGVAPSRVQGKPYVEIHPKREAMARFGLSAQDVLEVVEAGLGGRVVSTAIQGRERYPIQVRLQRDERSDIERLGDVLVTAPNGQVVPLGQIAEVRRVVGPSEIASENGRLRVFVQANVQDRDLGGFVDELKGRLKRDIEPGLLGTGMTLEYSGQFENQVEAERTLRLIIPVVLLIIFLLLFITYGSFGEAAHVLLAVPFALSGGVFLQWWLGYNFSVAVWVGYIALFGIAIQTGIVMVVFLEEMVAKKKAERGDAFCSADLIQAVKEGAKLRLRPKVMTVATTIASLLPIMWSARAGAEVMKPLAAPVIGGCLSSLVHILIVTPVIFAWLRERELRKGVKREA